MTEAGDEPAVVTEKSSVIDPKMVETRDLIEMVHRRRCLWDRTYSDYGNKYVKSKAWKEIYREIEPSYDSLKGALKNQLGLVITKKWYNVRDSYVKSKKASRTARPYIYSDELSFLDPLLKSDDNGYKEDKVANDSEGENWLGEVFVDVDDTEEVTSKRAKYDFNSTKEDSTCDSLREENVVSILANLIQKEDDDDRAFFKSITPIVKSLSQEGKLEFRIKVMKLLKVLKEREKIVVKRELSIVNSDSE